MKYLLDTNIFITAKNSYYAFDICPGFWKWLESCPDLFSTETVMDELLSGNDELAKWSKQQARLSPDFFIQAFDNIQMTYAEMLTYLADSGRYSRSVLEEYASVADSWLVATAKTLDYSIITNEKKDPNCRKKVKIPDVASIYEVPCLDVFQVLRLYGVKFDMQ